MIQHCKPRTRSQKDQRSHELSPLESCFLFHIGPRFHPGEARVAAVQASFVEITAWVESLMHRMDDNDDDP